MVGTVVRHHVSLRRRTRRSRHGSTAPWAGSAPRTARRRSPEAVHSPPVSDEKKPRSVALEAAPGMADIRA